MKNELSFLKFFAECMIVVAFLSNIGCVPKMTVFPDVPIHPVREYTYLQEKDKLIVAVEPYFETEKIITYFGTDLLSQGILPVLVVAENHHLKSGFLLDKTNISISKQNAGNSESEVAATTNRQQIMPYSQKPEELRKSSRNLMPFAALFPVLIVPGMIIDNQRADADSVIANLRKKLLIDRTIYPGQSNAGFVYFQMKDKEEINKVSSILIKSKMMISDEEIVFNYKISK